MDAARPRLIRSRNSSLLYAIPPPLPPSVNAGRQIAGSPIFSRNSSPSSTVVTVLDHGIFSPSPRLPPRQLPFLPDDLPHRLGRDRLDVRPVAERGVGHDRRRIRVHQHDPEPLRLQRLARLHARIVELAPLPDDNGPRAEDQ